MRASDDQVEVGEVTVDTAGRMFVHPLLSPAMDFAHIYRAAMEVSWDPKSKCLVTPPPRQWTQVDWFKQVVRAVQSEYGVRLYVSPKTRFSNFSPEDRREIELCAGPLGELLVSADGRQRALKELLVKLEETVGLLKGAKENQWAFRLEGDLETLLEGDLGAVDHLVGAFGGMGSLNDLYLCSENGHRVDAADLVAVNEKLQRLVSAIWQLARAAALPR